MKRDAPGRALLHAVLMTLSTSCALGPYGVVYSSVTRANEYPRPATRQDYARELDPNDLKLCVLERMTKTVCAHSVLALVAWGDSGVEAALRAFSQDEKAVAVVDVVVDVSYETILGVYSSACTRVSGRPLKSANTKGAPDARCVLD